VRKTALLLVLCLLFTAIPAGCYDQRELDDIAYVVALGLDKGVTDRLRLTLQVISFKEGGGAPRGAGGSGGGEDKEEGKVGNTVVITVEGASFFNCLGLANSASSRKLNLMHAKMLVFSEEVARSGELDKYVAPIMRYREIRETMNMIVTRGRAEDLIKELKAVIGREIYKSLELITEQPSYTGYFPEVKFYNFYNSLKSTVEQPVAVLAGVNSFKNLQDSERIGPPREAADGSFFAGDVPRQGGAKRELFGAAVFDGPRMVGELTGAEARVMRLIRGDFARGFFTIRDPEAPGYFVMLDARQARKPRVRVDLAGDVPEIYVDLRLEGDLLSVQSKVNYESPELKPVLERAFEEEIRRQADGLIAKCRDQFKADIFGFGRSAVRQFPTIREWRDYEWLEKFPQARVYIGVGFIVRRPGMILKSSPIIATEEGGQ